MADDVRIFDLLRGGIPLTLLIDLVDEDLSSERILLEERASGSAA